MVIEMQRWPGRGFLFLGWFFFSVFITFFLGAEIKPSHVRTVRIDTTKDDYAAMIVQAVPEVTTLHKISFSSDVFFEQDEFFYLTDLRESSQLTATQLVEAVRTLIKKNRFSIITLSLDSYDDGVQLHVDLVGFWSFDRLKIEGVLIGKDLYKHQYSMELGDPFNEELHETLLEKIRKDLKDKGFFKSSVTSEIKRDEKRKTVQVTLAVNRGPSFTALLEPVTVRAAADLSGHDVEVITAYIERHCLHRLSRFGYNKQTINKAALAIRKYLTAQGFLDAKIELEERIQINTGAVRISFIIDLHGKKKCTFLGNHFFTAAHLLEHIMSLGPSSWLLPTSMIQQDIIKLYTDKGFRDVQVALQEEPTELFFIINEGTRSRLDKVGIAGATLFTVDYVVKTYFKELLGQYCDEQAVQKALEAIGDAYTKQGFLDVSIPSIAWNRSDKKGRYDVQIVIDEGLRSSIESIRIPGYEQLEGKGPCALPSDGTAKPFHAACLHEQRAWLLKQLGLQESMNLSIRHELKRNGTKIAILWLVNRSTAPTMKFGKTIVTGCSGFPFALLKREFCYNEDDLWDQTALKNTLKRIKALDVFVRVHVCPHAPSIAQEKKAVLVKVHKDDRFEIRLRPGVALQQLSKKLCFNGLTYKLGGSFIVKNPLNAGDQFRVETDFTRSQQVFEISYRRPWLFFWPLKTIFKVYDNKYQQPGCIGIKKNVYQVAQQGFLTSLTKRHETYDASINLGFEYMQTIVQNKWNEHGPFALSIARAINFEPQLLGKKIPYAVIEPTVVVNKVDNNAFPRKGLLTVLSAKGMFPVGRTAEDLYFIRLLVEQSFYIPLRTLVMALRFRVGHLFHKDFASIMPTERFYLGGANSIRGYETDLCPPLGVVDDHGERRLVPQGGKSMVNLNIEGRFPLYGRLGGVLFQDIGALTRSTFLALKEEKLLAATGFGLRYHTPLGPLRFDFGIKWRAQVPHESRYAWFLTFGHAF